MIQELTIPGMEIKVKLLYNAKQSLFISNFINKKHSNAQYTVYYSSFSNIH